MKKSITLLCAFVLAITLNSCSSSSDDSSGGGGGGSSSDKIVGNWKLIGDIALGEFEPYDGETCELDYFKFSSDNTGKFIEKYCDDVDDVTPFGWVKTSDSANSYSFDNQPVFIVFSSDFKQFTVYYSEDEFINEDGGDVYKKY